MKRIEFVVSQKTNAGGTEFLRGCTSSFEDMICFVNLIMDMCEDVKIAITITQEEK